MKSVMGFTRTSPRRLCAPTTAPTCTKSSDENDSFVSPTSDDANEGLGPLARAPRVDALVRLRQAAAGASVRATARMLSDATRESG
jgi:hypothetical protein